MLKNNQGLTLVEVMIVGTLLMVMVLGLTVFMYQQAQIHRAQEVQQNMDHLKQSMIDASAQAETVIQSEQLQFGDIPL